MTHFGDLNLKIPPNLTILNINEQSKFHANWVENDKKVL